MMSVEISPQELGFRRPFTAEVSQILAIRNPNKNPVAFKVKTTAPKQYCVRPNSGRIEPDHEVEVTVLLQAMKQDPAPDARCRDKFLVQSVNIADNLDSSSVQQIWDAVDKASVQEKKIRVNWLPPSDQAAAATPVRHSLANGISSTLTPDVNPPPYSSPNEDYRTDAPQREIRSETAKDGYLEHDTEPEPSVLSAGTAIASVKSAAGSAADDLKEQLAKAQEKIIQLTQEVQSGLRQRKGTAAASDEKGAPAVEQLATAVRQGTEGVPIRIVAILCLVCFLLAYFFF